MWSPRTDLSPLGNSLASPRVPHDSFSFYCIPSSSTMTCTVVLIPTAAVLVLYAYSMQYKVSCCIQVLPWTSQVSKSRLVSLKGRCVSSWAPPFEVDQIGHLSLVYGYLPRNSWATSRIMRNRWLSGFSARRPFSYGKLFSTGWTPSAMVSTTWRCTLIRTWGLTPRPVKLNWTLAVKQTAMRTQGLSSPWKGMESPTLLPSTQPIPTKQLNV